MPQKVTLLAVLVQLVYLDLSDIRVTEKKAKKRAAVQEVEVETSEDEEDQPIQPKKTKTNGNKYTISTIPLSPLPDEAQWAEDRRKREAEEYKKLLNSKLDPSPKGKMVYVRDEASMETALAELAKNPQNDLAIHVGVKEHPVYIICLRFVSLNP